MTVAHLSSDDIFSQQPTPQPSRIKRNVIKQEGLLLFPEDVDKLRSPQTSDKMSTCGFSSHNLGEV